MSISVQSIYTDLRRDFGKSSEDATFRNQVLRAVNRSLGQMSDRAELETSLTLMTSISGAIEDVDDHMEYVIYDGARFWLPRMGVRQGDPKNTAAVLQDTKDNWEHSIGAYIGKLITDLNDEAVEDEDVDVAGQGNLGAD